MDGTEAGQSGTERRSGRSRLVIPGVIAVGTLCVLGGTAVALEQFGFIDYIPGFGSSAAELVEPETPTPSQTPSETPSPTGTPTPTETPTLAVTASFSETPTPTLPPSETPTPTLTPEPTIDLVTESNAVWGQGDDRDRQALLGGYVNRVNTWLNRFNLGTGETLDSGKKKQLLADSVAMFPLVSDRLNLVTLFNQYGQLPLASEGWYRILTGETFTAHPKDLTVDELSMGFGGRAAEIVAALADAYGNGQETDANVFSESVSDGVTVYLYYNVDTLRLHFVMPTIDGGRWMPLSYVAEAVASFTGGDGQEETAKSLFGLMLSQVADTWENRPPQEPGDDAWRFAELEKVCLVDRQATQDSDSPLDLTTRGAEFNTEAGIFDQLPFDEVNTQAPGIVVGTVDMVAFTQAVENGASFLEALVESARVMNLASAVWGDGIPGKYAGQDGVNELTDISVALEGQITLPCGPGDIVLPTATPKSGEKDISTPTPTLTPTPSETPTPTLTPTPEIPTPAPTNTHDLPTATPGNPPTTEPTATDIP